MTFNIDDGFPEAIVRGYRSGILTPADYANLTQCESLEGTTTFMVHLLARAHSFEIRRHEAALGVQGLR